MVMDDDSYRYISLTKTYGYRYLQYNRILMGMVHRQYGYGYLQCNRIRRGIVFLSKLLEIQFLLIVGINSQVHGQTNERKEFSRSLDYWCISGVGHLINSINK